MGQFKMTLVIFITFNLLAAGSVWADETQKKAIKLYTSLTGTTPSRSEITIIKQAIENGQLNQVALDIVESQNGFNNYGAFYNVTVRDFATPWSTEDGSPFSKLNDMTATVIGYTRDEKPFNEILWRDTVYKLNGLTFKGGQLYYFTGNNYPANTSASTVCVNVHNSDPGSTKMRVWFVDPNNPNSAPTDVANTRCQLTDYSSSELDNAYSEDYLYVPKIDQLISTTRIKESNSHYEDIELNGIDLSDTEIFKETTQLVKLHQEQAAVAGLLSTRAFGKAYYSDGTNRAAFAFSMKYFFCKEMEELNDTSIPDYRNRRDVDRSPGGISSTYKNRCVGCHAGMDAMSGAFAYYDYNGAVQYEEGNVVEKMNHNVIFPDGYVTSDDSWINLWTEGQNSSLGWGGSTTGHGAKDFGQMLASTEAFSECMGKQVYKKVCFRDAVTAEDEQVIKSNVSYFKSQNYNMKKLFIKTAISCLED